MEKSPSVVSYGTVSGPTEIPLARAASHLAAARYAEAAGAYRAVLCIDPHAHQAYLGLAECALGRGQPEEAIEELVGAAQDFAERGALEAAFALMTKALIIDPTRLELHIDVAELEASAGRPDMAVERLHNLACAYEAAGQYDEAMAVVEVASAFASTEDEEEDRPEPGTTTLVTPREALAEQIVAIEVEAAVPVVVAQSHTMPQELPPARTGDTFVGPAPTGPTAEPSIARTAARRNAAAPALRWRPSTSQMQALTAEMPTPDQLVRSGPGVPRTVAPARTAPIVHAPSRRRSDATVAEGSRHRPRAAATPVEVQHVATKPILAAPIAATPVEVKHVVTKPIVAAPVQAKPIAVKPVEPKPVEPTQVQAKPIETKPVEPKPVEAKPIAAEPETKPARRLEIQRLPGRVKPRPAPAPAPKRVEARPQPKPRPATPAPVLLAPARKPAPSPKPAPKRTAPPRRPDPAPRKEGESLADRLRRQSTGRHHLAAKVKRIADAEKRRLTNEGFDEDATSLWCPENLRLPEAR